MLRMRELGTLVAIASMAAVAACDRSGTAPDPTVLRPAVSLLSGNPDDTGNETSADASATFGAEGGRLEWAGGRLQSSLIVAAGALAGATSFEFHADATLDHTRLVVRAVSVNLDVDPQESAGEEGIQLVVRNPTGADQQVEVAFVPPDGGDPISVRTLLYAGDARSLDIRRGRSKYSVIFF